jgi:predicted nucleic acid-binding protein
LRIVLDTNIYISAAIIGRACEEILKIYIRQPIVKYTQYFLYTCQRPDRSKIKDDWIKSVINNPIKIEKQADG